MPTAALPPGTLKLSLKMTSRSPCKKKAHPVTIVLAFFSPFYSLFTLFTCVATFFPGHPSAYMHTFTFSLFALDA